MTEEIRVMDGDIEQGGLSDWIEPPKTCRKMDTGISDVIPIIVYIGKVCGREF